MPSAVRRVRSHAEQNDRVTDAMMPTVAGPPSTSHSSAGADGSSRHPHRWRAAMWGKKAGHGIDDEDFVRPMRSMGGIGG